MHFITWLRTPTCPSYCSHNPWECPQGANMVLRVPKYDEYWMYSITGKVEKDYPIPNQSVCYRGALWQYQTPVHNHDSCPAERNTNEYFAWLHELLWVHPGITPKPHSPQPDPVPGNTQKHSMKKKSSPMRTRFSVRDHLKHRWHDADDFRFGSLMRRRKNNSSSTLWNKKLRLLWVPPE